MSALRIALPLAAVVFFLWKARTSRIYLLGIPFLMYMRESVLLDNLRVFSLPHRLSHPTITLAWLVLVWLLSTDLLLPRVNRARRRALGPRLLPEETVLVLIAGLVLMNTVVTAVERGDLSSALGQATGFLYLLVGYVLIRAIVSQVPTKQVIDFLWALVVLNTIAACLFIVHQGLGFHVYTVAEYHVDVFQGVVITRTFSFMPPLILLALAFTFAQRRWTVPTYLVAGINVVAILISYTRSMLLMALVAGLTVVVVRLLRRRQAGLAVRRVATLALVAAMVGILAVTFLPTKMKYFEQRMSRATTNVTSDPSYVRVRRLRLEYAQVASTDVVLGKGFVSQAQDPTVAAMETQHLGRRLDTHPLSSRCCRGRSFRPSLLAVLRESLPTRPVLKRRLRVSRARLADLPRDPLHRGIRGMEHHGPQPHRPGPVVVCLSGRPGGARTRGAAKRPGGDINMESVSDSQTAGTGDAVNVACRRPRVTFGVIVLNGEPFTRYCLRSLYPFAHEIIVVEGAVPGAAGASTPDGHSSDGTLDVLREFQSVEDPHRRVQVVTAEDEGHPNGFWPGEKDEQSQAYARRATGDYLWQVDIDEFYTERDMRLVLETAGEQTVHHRRVVPDDGVLGGSGLSDRRLVPVAGRRLPPSVVPMAARVPLRDTQARHRRR